MCVEVGPLERLLELIPVNTPREGAITPLGRYFDVHGLPREQSDHRGAGGRL
jgi:hypothetical protein